MMRYKISGMSCVACSAKGGLGLADRTANKVDLILNSNLDDSTMKSVVETAGYKYFG